MKYKRIDTKEMNNGHFFITDGKNIIYVQKDKHYDLYMVTTVHQPNTITGTGVQIAENITVPELLNNLDVYLKTFAPSWATQKEIDSVKKYSTLEQFLNYERKFWGDKIFINDLKLNYDLSK